MIPAISLLDDCEMLRDGGSLCFSFQDPSGTQWWLLTRRSESGDGYSSPFLQRYDLNVKVEIEWSDLVSYCQSGRDSINRDWKGGTKYLDHNIVSANSWLDAMELVGKHRGKMQYEDVHGIGFAYLHKSSDA
ncbi:hypothetical protein GCM10008940_34850 [Microbulbifer agarilyticus]